MEGTSLLRLLGGDEPCRGLTPNGLDAFTAARPTMLPSSTVFMASRARSREAPSRTESLMSTWQERKGNRNPQSSRREYIFVGRGLALALRESVGQLVNQNKNVSRPKRVSCSTVHY
jgi:hypothetical protein